jgi:vesicle coat complex subunit
MFQIAAQGYNARGGNVSKHETTEAYNRQGKVAELRQELATGGKKDKNHSAKKIALKKIVANMTMSNNDMAALFPDVVACMQIQSLEIKKMYELRYRTTTLD